MLIYRALRPVVIVVTVCLPVSCRQTSPNPSIEVPYPNSVVPTEVVANIKAIIGRQPYLARDMKMPELEMHDNGLLARRVLQVRSEKQPPEYLVIELEDVRGKFIARFLMTRSGRFMGIEDCRLCPSAYRSLDLADASSRVRARGENPLAVEYVYFDNVAEPGYSRGRPLVAVSTERGMLYFNSRAEAFAEEDSPLMEKYGGSKEARLPLPRGIRQLRPLGLW